MLKKITVALLIIISINLLSFADTQITLNNAVIMQTGGEMMSAVICNGYMYGLSKNVAGSLDGLFIYDITDLDNPRNITPDNVDIKGDIPNTTCRATVINNGYLYVVFWLNNASNAEVRRYSLQNPENPQLVASYYFNELVHDITENGSYIYVSGYEPLTAINVDTGQSFTAGMIRDYKFIKYHDGKIYAASSGKVSIIDTYKLTNNIPGFVDKTITVSGYSPYAIDFSGEYIVYIGYTNDWTKRKILMINPETSQIHTNPSGNQTYDRVENVKIKNGLMRAANIDNKLQFFDISTADNINVLSEVTDYSTNYYYLLEDYFKNGRQYMVSVNRSNVVFQPYDIVSLEVNYSEYSGGILKIYGTALGMDSVIISSNNFITTASVNEKGEFFCDYQTAPPDYGIVNVSVNSYSGAVKSIPVMIDEAAGVSDAVIRISDDVAPGDLFTIYGNGFYDTELYASVIENGEIPQNIPDGIAFKIEVINNDIKGNYLTARFPKNKQGGRYALWIKSGGAFFKPAILNMPRPQWLSESSAAPEQIVKVYGRGLSPLEYGSQSDVSVRLKNNENIIYTDIISQNPFEIAFKIPENALAGQYIAEISTGSGIWQGLEYTEFTPYLTVVPPASDPLNLGVWWAGEFNWSNVFYPDDNTAEGIQSAIDNAWRNGGGVVSLSAGIYDLGDKNLRLRDNVVLKGEGKDSTILKTSGAWQIIETRNNQSGLIGVADLNIEFYSSSPEIKQPDALINFDGSNLSRAFVVNVKGITPKLRRSGDGRGFGFMSDAKSDVILKNCEFTGYAAMWLEVKKHMKIINNKFNINTGCIYSLGICQTIERNDINIDTSLEESFDYNAEGVIARGPSYVAFNNITGAGKENHNDGEIILSENAGKLTMFFGDIVSSTGTLVNVSPLYDTDWAFSEEAWSDWHIAVVSGKGLGQYRRVVSSDKENNRLTIDKAWDIVPDSTSKFTVIMPTKGMTVYNNYAENCAKGYWFFNDVIDSVMYGNTGVNTEGIMNHAFALDNSDRKEFSIVYFNRIEKNNISGESPKSGISAIGDIAKLELNTEAGYEPKMKDTFGLTSYGTEILKNEFTGSADHITHNNQTSEAPDICGIYFSQLNRVQITSSCSEAAIIQGNSIKNSERGITIGGGVYPSEWFDAFSEMSVGVSGVTVSENSFLNVRDTYISTLGTENAKQITNDTITGIKPKLFRNNRQVSSLDTGENKLSLQVENISEDETGYIFYAVMINEGKIVRIEARKEKIAAGGEKTLEIDFTVSAQEKAYKLAMYIWKDNLEPANAVTYYTN